MKSVILFGFNFSASSQLSKFIRDEWRDDTGEFKNLFAAAKSAYINVSKSEEQNRDRKRNCFHSVAKNMIVFPVLLPNSTNKSKVLWKHC